MPRACKSGQYFLTLTIGSRNLPSAEQPNDALLSSIACDSRGLSTLPIAGTIGRPHEITTVLFTGTVDSRLNRFPRSPTIDIWLNRLIYRTYKATHPVQSIVRVPKCAKVGVNMLKADPISHGLEHERPQLPTPIVEHHAS